MDREQINELAGQIFDAAFAVHSQLGPGLLESAYTSCLLFELTSRGISVQREVAVPLVYKETKLGDVGYRIDLLVEQEIVVEVKAIETLAPVHHAQLLSYLRLSGKRLGLLINFNVASLKDGISRRANRL